MKTVIFDGQKAGRKIGEKLKTKLEKLKKQGKIPSLVSILVGDNLASKIYLKKKKEFAARIGLDFKTFYFQPNEIKKIKRTIGDLNCDQNVGGIMVQLPLPDDWLAKDKLTVLNLISPEKDVDCLTAFNLGRLFLGQPLYLPATVLAIKKILQLAGLNKNNILGKNACVVGKSSLIGKPTAILLTNMGATVTVCHRQTKDLIGYTAKADILISATGQPNLINGRMVKKGAIAIDVGSPKPDFDFKSVSKKAKFITPVPSGVGPMTVACLMENFLQSISGNSFLFADQNIKLAGKAAKDEF